MTTEELQSLLQPYYPHPSPLLLDQLTVYLQLLLKWNAKTNLTAIRNPDEIVKRHFGESLFAASLLPPANTLLDLGSGAGFPGLPIQLAHPRLRVTLAESQNKKASFLREVVRTLHLSTEIWAQRAELLPPERTFDIVTLRAVDRPEEALDEAKRRISPSGWIIHLDARNGSGRETAIPFAANAVVRTQQIVPRGTIQAR